MSRIPSTWLLRRLREVVTDPTNEHAVKQLESSNVILSEDWLVQVREHRASFRAELARGGYDPKLTKALFLKTWTLFCGLSATHPLHLYPIFQEAAFLKLVQQEATRVYWIERREPPFFLNIGNRIFGGTSGVGKTYMLRGLALVISVLCETANPVTFSYGDAGVPSHKVIRPTISEATAMVPISVLLDADYLYNTCPTEKMCGDELLQLSRDTAITGEEASAFVATRKVPVLLLDDIHLWYRHDGLMIRGQICNQQLLYFGFKPSIVAVVSGSSPSFFNKVSARGLWAERYVELRYDLFFYEVIRPLRDVQAVSLYLAASHYVLPPDLTYQALLSLSGGIGRVICSVLAGERQPSGRMLPATLFRDDSRFAKLMRFFLTDGENKQTLAAAPQQAFPPPISMALAEVHSFMGRQQVPGKDIDRLLNRWCEYGILLCSGQEGSDPIIELLYPYHAHILARLLEAPATGAPLPASSAESH